MTSTNVEEILQQLLMRDEGTTLDFKRDAYSLRGEHEKGAFLKDIVSMANTPRDDSSYIVFGVKKAQGDPPMIQGVAAHRDESEYQEIVTRYVRPTPTIRYLATNINGKKVGILEIPPMRTGPFRLAQDMGNTRRLVTYFRAGSRNTEAADADEQLIREWHSQSPTPEAAPADWEDFGERVGLLEPDRLQILVAGPLGHDRLNHVKGLASAQWFAVFDFDTESDERGLLASLRPDLELRMQIHEVTRGVKHSINIGSSTYWYFARGLTSRANTEVTRSGFAAWARAYGSDIHAQLMTFAEKTGIRPATFTLICETADYPRKLPFFKRLIQAAIETFGERARFAVCSPAARPEDFEEYDDLVEAFPLTPEDLARGLAYSLDEDNANNDALPWELPARNGIPVQVETVKRPWLLEELDVLYRLSGADGDMLADPYSFLRGAQITWRQLALHHDVDRDPTPKILKNLRLDLGLTGQHAPGPLRYSLYHEPGSGGTTVARRVLWELSKEIPAATLKSSTPIETAERIRYLHDATSLPVIVLVEARDVSEKTLDELYTVIAAQQIPCVILQVFRGFHNPGRPRPRSSEGGTRSTRVFFLRTRLSNVEANLFAERFCQVAPTRRRRIEALTRSNENERQPFFFGLHAFEERFLGLSSFVEERLAPASPEQREIMLFLALSYHYGHANLSQQMFADLIGLPKGQRVDLRLGLPRETLTLLVEEGESAWRPSHDLIAQEIIRQILNPAATDKRVWRQNLGDWAIEFARFCSSATDGHSEEIENIVHRCFLLRESRSFLGREEPRRPGGGAAFSRLLTDIPSPDERHLVLKALTELFPDDPHIWAHMGRFIYQEGHPQEAIPFIDRSIELSPSDPLLYHMKGMALRAAAYDLLDDWKRDKSESTLAEVLALVAQAGDQFEHSRGGPSQDEHGYVSHIQMLTRLLDAAQVVYGGGDAGKRRTRESPHVLLREALDTAEGLLEIVRLLQSGERESEYVLKCVAELDSLYGNHSAALQVWDSLLSRPNIYRPSIRRQIVRGHLSRFGRRWSDIPQEQIRRIVNLLEENIREEPGDERNIRMWIQAVRRQTPAVPLERATSRIAYWKANALSVDAAYYLYVLHTLAALEGSPVARDAATEALAECKRRSRMQRNRSISFEWLGRQRGIQRLIHHSELGAWNSEAEFWGGAEILDRVVGSVASIRGPEAGELELPGGVHAFFVPNKAGLAKGRDENVRVTLFLGFSYDGPRAWEVKRQ